MTWVFVNNENGGFGYFDMMLVDMKMGGVEGRGWYILVERMIVIEIFVAVLSKRDREIAR